MTVARPARRRLDLAILLLVALAVRWATFGNPVLHVDEEFYFTTARLMGSGKLLYIDVWDRKPAGLFLLYLLPASLPLPWGTYAYQALALGFVVATAGAILALARRAGWARGALVAALLYIVWLDLPDGQGGQSPVFYNLPMALAALATMTADRADARARRRAGIAAMLLTGLALQIKYSVVFEGAFFGLWLLSIEHRRSAGAGGIAGHGAALIAAALLPTAIIAGWYAAIGAFDAFWFANFRSILARNADPYAEQWGNLKLAAAILGPLLALAAAGIGGPGDAVEVTRRRFVWAWLAASVAGFLAFGSWFNHYTLPVLVPACVAIAGAVTRRRWGRGAAIVLVVLGAIAGQIVLWSERRIRGTADEFAAVAAAIGHGRGALYVYSGTVMAYPASGRPALTPYIFSSHLWSAREDGAVGIDQDREIARILKARPAVVMVQSLDGGELARRHRGVVAWLDAHRYRATRLSLGDKFVDIYKAPGG